MLKQIARSGIAALCAVTAGMAGAQTYPTKPINLIVPFSTGGPSDAHMRQLSVAMGKILNQSFIIENVPGGGGNIGPARVSKSAPDGYTILQHNTGITTAPALYKNLGYNVLTDFDYIGSMVFDPSCMMVRSDFPGNTFREMVDYIKANQAKISLGEGGGPSQLSALLFMQHTGTKLTLIPYKGTGPAMNDLLSKTIDMLSNSASIVGPQIRAGKVKALGITGKQRVTNLPEVPTLDEQGLTGFDMVVFTSLFAPKNLPKPVLDRLVGALQSAIANDPDLRAHVGRTGGIFATREQASPAGLQALIKTEVEKWVPLLRNAGVQPE